MIHIPLVVTAALIPLAGYPLLYLPIHIVWLELVIHPTALLAFQDLPAPGRLADRASARGRDFFSRREWAGIALVGTLLTALVSFGYDCAASGPRATSSTGGRWRSSCSPSRAPASPPP